MPNAHYQLFPTAIGVCGLLWDPVGICAVQLPASDADATRLRLCRRHSDAQLGRPPPAIATVIEQLTALLTGKVLDLSDAVLNLQHAPAFHRRVYDVVRRIPVGSTLSYGEVAARCGEPQAARAVGQAMARNPVPLIVPCHRVLAARGRRGGFSAPGGVDTKLRLLHFEGAVLPR